jgi:glycosyltransferase involved in cell wall biosynthesis
MAMSIPVVTFGVGGVGEYIELDQLGSLSESESESEYEIAKNVILLNKASPKVIAAATEELIFNFDLRIRIGLAGRATVVKYFSLERQIKEYAHIYRKILGK